MNQEQRSAIERVLRFAELMDTMAGDLFVISTNTGAKTPLRSVIEITGPVATHEDFATVRALIDALEAAE